MEDPKEKNEQPGIVSRKTNEEIDVDESGNLLIDGKNVPNESTNEPPTADANPDDDQATHIED